MNTPSTKMNDVNAIRIYGGSVEGIPNAPNRITSLFNVAAETYMLVPETFMADVIAHLKKLRYIYKVRNMTKYVAIAVQYQLPA